MSSKYWDDFKKRERETVIALKTKKLPPVRRVAVFITNLCNFRCAYCNMTFARKQIPKEDFNKIVNTYPDSIIHITGGEPSTVKWLYNYIDTSEGRFHLNTNGYIKPPRNIKRLKVSLDSHREEYFNKLVGKKKAFKKVVKHIKDACKYTVVSITYVLNKENYKEAHEFMKFCRVTFPKLYAVFFSIYKGDNPRFKMSKRDVDIFFNQIRPKLEKEMDKESLNLFRETIDEKRRLLQGIRFPENKCKSICYLSLSERAFDWDGKLHRCSHLLRDGIANNNSIIHSKCRYGCNRRLVKFNEDVEKLLRRK